MKRKIEKLYRELNYNIMAMIVKSEMENVKKNNLIYDIAQGKVMIIPGDVGGDKQRPLHCRFVKNSVRLNMDFARELEKIVNNLIAKKVLELAKEINENKEDKTE